MAPASLDLNTKTKDLAVLKDELSKTSKNVLERVILEASQNDGRVAKLFWDALVTTRGAGRTLEKVAKFETCRHCNQDYDYDSNDHDSCVWHYGPSAAPLNAAFAAQSDRLEGNLIIDEEFWVDFDIDDEPIDTEENRKEFPQGFFWDCCGLQCDSEGCIKTEHASQVILKRSEHALDALDSERHKDRPSYVVYERRFNDHDPAPSKKRKVGAKAEGTKCRTCGDVYDENANEKRICHWHDLDAVRRFTGKREDQDRNDNQVYSDKEEADEDNNCRTVQWTCCGSDQKGGGCNATPHLPPKREKPKVKATA